MKHIYSYVKESIRPNLNHCITHPPWILMNLGENKIEAFKLKIIKNVPIHPEIYIDIFCLLGGGEF